jgi:hypothetical protein
LLWEKKLNMMSFASYTYLSLYAVNYAHESFQATIVPEDFSKSRKVWYGKDSTHHLFFKIMFLFVNKGKD